MPLSSRRDRLDSSTNLRMSVPHIDIVAGLPSSVFQTSTTSIHTEDGSQSPREVALSSVALSVKLANCLRRNHGIIGGVLLCLIFRKNMPRFEIGFERFSKNRAS